MIKTADCVRAIVATVPSSENDWKRESKRKIDGLVERLFINRATGQRVIVTATEIEITKIETLLTFGPVKVGRPKFNIIPCKEKRNVDGGLQYGLTGRVLYDLADDGLDTDELGFFYFYCGEEVDDGSPPGVDGALNDQGSEAVDAVLRQLFVDVEIDVGAAESYHGIKSPWGMTPKQTWTMVEARLKAAGAVKMKMR